MADVSVGGGVSGGLYSTALTTAEANLATSLLGSFTTSEVNYAVGPSGDYGLGTADQVLILGATNPTANDTISSQNSGAVIVGNQGNDTFFLSASGSVIGGNGNNFVVDSGSGTSLISLGNGSDTVNLQGNGSVTLGSGNDTVNLGSGNDTVKVAGMATVSSTYAFADMNGGTLSQQVVGGVEIVTAKGLVSVHGGAGEWLKGSDGAVIKAMGGNDTLQGYQGNVTLIGDANAQTDFVFNKAGSGVFQDTISGVAAGDKIELVGVNINQMLANHTNTGNYISFTGGNTVIHLGNGSTITITGIHHLGSGAFTTGI
jgi:Ca2+-binding RTX toxin-like protein